MAAPIQIVTFGLGRRRCASSIAADKYDDASPLDCAQRTSTRHTLVLNVVRAAGERIDGEVPDALRVHRHFEIERLPEHVHHDVHVFVTAKSGDGARQRPPLWIVKARVA